MSSNRIYERNSDHLAIGAILSGLMRAVAICLSVVVLIGSEMISLKDAAAMEPAAKEEMLTYDMLYAPLHWQDATTGFAIGGFDTVAYFGKKQTQLGLHKYQYFWRGSNWRFVNSGNLRAFKRSPEAYVPRYAGYDPYALSKGILVEGHPAIWSISNGQLFLFFSDTNRFLWEENIVKARPKTNRNWRHLSLQLQRHKIDK